MADRIRVKCINKGQWGSRVYGASGAIYQIATGGLLHVMLAGDVPDPEPGAIHQADADEFAKLPNFRVDGVAKAAPPPPTRPSAGGPSDSGEAPPDPDAETAEDEGPPALLVEKLPAPEATKAVWLDWAREHGIALSPNQKKLKSDDLQQAISEAAADRDAASS